MVFQPGQSGNPSGRRKKSAEDLEAEALARQHGPAAIRSLVRIAIKGKSESAVVAASVAILDRGYGRPTQPIEQDLNVYNYGIADRQPTADEWLDKYAAMPGQPSHIAH